jgi:hypothetical protein
MANLTNSMWEVKTAKRYDIKKFRPASSVFEEYGYYTAAPRGTTEYKNYWDTELRRCIHGYTTEDGDFISGYFYFYLNYSRIEVTKEEYITDKRGKTKRVSSRPESFPFFYDYDWAYFNAVEECENQGKHLTVLKKRGAGYSFKGASMLVRNFYCIPKSKSYAIASEMEFLTKDGVLSKAWHMMSFIDKHTAWGKRRQKIDRATHKKASFVYKDPDTDITIEDGWGSEIIGVSLKNDPQKARGKRGKLILWEEAGKFPNLKQSWQVARPSVESGNIAFGLMIAYGTGGTVGADYEGLKELFYEPDVYNCLHIKNDWDEGLPTKPCGFFVPWYSNLEGKDEHGVPFMDEFGNSDIRRAVKWALEEREKVAEASDKRSIDMYIAERPFNPAEATLQVSGNIFPKKDLMRHLSDLRTSKSLSGFKQVGELYFNPDGAIKWEPAKERKDLTKHRLGPTDDPAGAIVIWEHPPTEEIPYGLYIMGVDPYDHDESSTDSLGSCIVYKRFQNFESYYDLPVAEYTGRPETAEEFYEICRKLAIYYKAKILYENEKKGLFSYFSHKHCEYLLADQPDIIKDIIADSKVSRSKGIHMTKEIKMWGERLIKTWLTEEYAPGKKNLTKIFSEPLLEELISFNYEGNFDRVMAFIMVMIYKDELYHNIVKQKKSTTRKKLFEQPLFLTNYDDN